jgi:hypothetical protein
VSGHSTLLIGVFGAGFLLAVAGHLAGSRALAAFGIALVFGATVAIPLLIEATD